MTGQDVIFHPISNTDLGAAYEGINDRSETEITQQCHPLG